MPSKGKHTAQPAINYLEQNRVDHMDMLEPLRRGTAEVVDLLPDGALVYERTARLYLLTAETPGTAERLANQAGQASLAAAHQAFGAQMLAARLGLRRTMRCRQAVWLSARPPAVAASPLTFSVLPETGGMADEIAALYSHAVGDGYIRGRLAAAALFGAFLGEELAGFIGLHEEGSMGMLEVKPAFRRRGVASQLLAFLCARLLAEGRTPFSQFEEANTASEQLHRHLGFAVSAGEVLWLER